MGRLFLLVALIACNSKRETPAASIPITSASDTPADSTIVEPRPTAWPQAWPELAELPKTDPIRVIQLPSRREVPQFDVGGPVVLGDLAIVGCSQVGFAAVDWRRGALAWTKPTGAHLAPPLVHHGEVVLIADCTAISSVPDGNIALGCLRIVSRDGVERSYVAIHGPAAAIGSFASSPGRQELWSIDEHTVRWRRGEVAVSVDVRTGVASSTVASAPALVVRHRERAWEIEQLEGRIVAHHHHADPPRPGQRRRPAWRTKFAYTALLGPVYLPDHAPMIRVANAGAFQGQPELTLFDIDATGSLEGQASFPVPGIALLGFGSSSIGDVALAVRLDRSIQRDFIAGYAANALLLWVYPLPEILRPDPVGVAIASEAVIVFHDGDVVTILPEVSAPPTAPGAARAPLENPTP